MGRDAKSRLFVTDLDGTLLCPDATVSAYTVGVLNRMIEEGFLFTYSTARSYFRTSKLLKDIRFTIPVIVFNGAFLIDPTTGEQMISNLLDRTLAEEILEAGARMGLSPFLYGLEDGREVVQHLELQNEGQRLFLPKGDPRFLQVDAMRMPQQVIQFNFIATREELLPLKDWAEQRFGDAVTIKFGEDIYLNGHYSLGFFHPDADKGVMVKKLAAHLGVPLSHVTAFGDHLNDLGLFSAAAHKIAVQNAHPTVLDLADEVIGSNAEDGVARYLARVCWGEKAAHL